ncbi:MAG: Holliday junction resolvase RuvX [Chloroflexota bacterium]|nr:Holliday junction resolvase RuvX [Chloroflexota bacterium]
MKSLGLDIGDRRVGIAFADSDVHLATPVDVLTRSSIDQDARALGELARDYDAVQLVVGLPRNMDGTRGAQVASVVAYAEKLARALNLPVIFWDERLTTVEATRRMEETGVPSTSARRGKKSRRAIDAVAAAVILQDYLDSQGNKEA